MLDPTPAGLTTDIAASVAAAGTRSANPFTRIGALFGRTSDEPADRHRRRTDAHRPPCRRSPPRPTSPPSRAS